MCNSLYWWFFSPKITDIPDFDVCLHTIVYRVFRCFLSSRIWLSAPEFLPTNEHVIQTCMFVYLWVVTRDMGLLHSVAIQIVYLYYGDSIYTHMVPVASLVTSPSHTASRPLVLITPLAAYWLITPRYGVNRDWLPLLSCYNIALPLSEVQSDIGTVVPGIYISLDVILNFRLCKAASSIYRQQFCGQWCGSESLHSFS